MVEMVCSAVDGEIAPFIEGELDEARSRMVSRHLKLCTGCWRKAVALSRVVGLLLEGEWSEPPPGLARRTLERCTAELR